VHAEVPEREKTLSCMAFQTGHVKKGGTEIMNCLVIWGGKEKKKRDLEKQKISGSWT